MKEETKRKISATLKGRKVSKETKKKLSIALQGHSVSEETKKKISWAHKGKKLSEQHIKKCVQARKGYRHSEETRMKIGRANSKIRTPRYEITCSTCGKVFVSRNKEQKYCCISCRRFKLICKKCGRSFVAKAHNKKYCPSCLMHTCEVCGKVFKSSGGYYKVPRKYCSVECFHKARLGAVPWNKGKQVSLVCLTCGGTFVVPEARKDTVKYCSLNCLYEAMSHITGEEHPLWKGGYDLYGRMLSQNEGSFYRNRKLVLMRDNQTCQWCNYSGSDRYMDVHHIIPVRKGGANTLENMITLCRKCHNQADAGKISPSALMEIVNKRNLYRERPLKRRRPKLEDSQFVTVGGKRT